MLGGNDVNVERLKERKRKAAKLWRQRFPLKAKAHDINCYVSRKYQNRGSIDQFDVFALLRSCGGLCVRCGKHFPAGRFSFDHVIPLSLNGDNCLENLQLLCLKCNRAKHTMDHTITAWTTKRAM